VSLALVLFLATAYPVVLWTEAEKEGRILCSMLPPGTPDAEVIRTLETGNLLRYGPQAGGGADPGSAPENAQEGGRMKSMVLLVESPWALDCRLTMVGGAVARNAYHSSFHLATAGAWVASAGFLLLLVFQLLLALVAPLGHLAWGVRHRVLPPPLKGARFLSAAVLLLGITAVLQKTGIVAHLPWPRVAETLPWILAPVFLLSLLGSSWSESPWKRRLGVPLALILSLACVAVGMGS
jgi:hypothetical protein